MTRHEARSGNGVGAVWLNNKRTKKVCQLYPALTRKWISANLSEDFKPVKMRPRQDIMRCISCSGMYMAKARIHLEIGICA